MKKENEKGLEIAEEVFNACWKCVHRRKQFTCFSSVCKLGNDNGCVACGYIKLNGLSTPFPKYCKDFKEEK